MRSTPESMTATTTDGSPVVVGQASGTPICSRSFWPANNGSDGLPSSGQSSRDILASGTTTSTSGLARRAAATSAVRPGSVVTTDRIGREVRSVEATPGIRSDLGAAPFQTTIRRPSYAAASAATRAEGVAAPAGAAATRTSASATSAAKRERVSTRLPL